MITVELSLTSICTLIDLLEDAADDCCDVDPDMTQEEREASLEFAAELTAIREQLRKARDAP